MKKRILLINPFDSLPGENQRAHRYTILYAKLKKNYDVTWISSNFQHYSHKKRNATSLSTEDKKKIILIPMMSYKKNVSFKRFISYLLLSIRTLWTVIRSNKRYDLILCWGPVELVYLMTLYAKYMNIKIVIDVIDIWPDLFVMVFPKKMRMIGKFLLSPYYLMSKKSYHLATHITSVSKTYTEWALKRGKRTDSINSSYYYLGCNTSIKEYNNNKSSTQLRCLFAGQFGFNYDVETLVAVARKLQDNNITNIEIILAGDGYKKNILIAASEGLTNVRYTGWITAGELNSIAAECHVGFNAYTPSATQSIPFKPFDYMSMGLYIMNSLKGEMEEFIKNYGVGGQYESQNVDDLYEKLITLAANINRVIAVGHNSYMLFKNKFNADVIYDKMINEIVVKNIEK